jgi:hypothetical protein
MGFERSGFSLLDVMLLIGLEGRSGELVVEAGNNIGSLLFHEGRVLLAFSPYTQAIGDRLVEQGILTDAELLDVLKQQRTGPHTPVGALLLGSGKVSFQQIESMVHEQIRKAVNDFLAWKNVDYSFQQKEVRPFDSINLPVHEFLPSETIKAALVFVAGLAGSLNHAAGQAQPTFRS